MKPKPIKRLMYMAIRRRPRAIDGPWEDYGHARDMAKYAASTKGGLWRAVPCCVSELPTDGKYTEEGERVTPGDEDEGPHPDGAGE